MQNSSKQVLLGMLSGSLITMGLGLAFIPALFFVSLHHMFILGFQPRGSMIVLLLPMVLIFAGVFVAVNTLQNGRRAVGTLLILLPVLLLIGTAPVALLVGTMGMDVHWTSKVPLYVVGTCLLVVLSGCIALGIHLRRTEQGEKMEG